jgi:hypothetical protein
MMVEIWKVRVRDALVPRREPYWGPPLGQGKSFGLRKVDATQSRWIAKFRNESGHHSKVLGDVTPEFSSRAHERPRSRGSSPTRPGSRTVRTPLNRPAETMSKTDERKRARNVPTMLTRVSSASSTGQILGASRSRSCGWPT